MRHGFAWRSKRLNVGTLRKDFNECSVEEDVGKVTTISRPKTEFVVGIIDHDEVDVVETELCMSNDAKKHDIVSHHETNAKNEDFGPCSLLNTGVDDERSGEEYAMADNRSLRRMEEKAYQDVTTENRGEVSIRRSIKKGGAHSVRERSRALLDEEQSTSTSPPKENEEQQRDDIGAHDAEERLAVVPEKENDSTRDGNHSTSLSYSTLATTFHNEEESTPANNTGKNEVATPPAGSIVREEDGTSPIDFINAIISGEVWSDIFDEGKNGSRHSRSASIGSDNALLEAISDFIQGDESKRAFFESQVAQLRSPQTSRREQAKSMNVSRARETKALSLLHLVPPTSANQHQHRDSNRQRQQSNTMTPINGPKTTKAGVVAFMKTRVAGHLAREIVISKSIDQKESRLRTTRSKHQSHHGRPPQDRKPVHNNKSTRKRIPVPWIEQRNKTLSTSSQISTREKSRDGKKNKNNEAQGDNCFRLVEECWVEISRALLCVFQESCLGTSNNGSSDDSEEQRVRSSPASSTTRKQGKRRTTWRSLSPNRKSRRGGDGVARVAATHRPTSTRATSPSRSRRSISQPPPARPSSPSSFNKRKTTRQGRSVSCSPPTRRGGGRGGQGSKTSSPTSTISRHCTSAKNVTGSRSSRGIHKSPRSSPSNLSRRGVAMSIGSTGSRSSKRLITVRNMETKRKNHQQQHKRNIHHRSPSSW